MFDEHFNASSHVTRDFAKPLPANDKWQEASVFRSAAHQCLDMRGILVQMITAREIVGRRPNIGRANDFVTAAWQLFISREWRVKWFEGILTGWQRCRKRNRKCQQFLTRHRIVEIQIRTIGENVIHRVRTQIMAQIHLHVYVCVRERIEIDFVSIFPFAAHGNMCRLCGGEGGRRMSLTFHMFPSPACVVFSDKQTFLLLLLWLLSAIGGGVCKITYSLNITDDRRRADDGGLKYSPDPFELYEINLETFDSEIWLTTNAHTHTLTTNWSVLMAPGIFSKIVFCLSSARSSVPHKLMALRYLRVSVVSDTSGDDSWLLLQLPCIMMLPQMLLVSPVCTFCECRCSMCGELVFIFGQFGWWHFILCGDNAMVSAFGSKSSSWFLYLKSDKKQNRSIAVLSWLRFMRRKLTESVLSGHGGCREKWCC